MEIDYDALVDEELKALSDCSSVCSETDDGNEETNDDISDQNFPSEENEWLSLFLSKTTQQSNKTVGLLNDAQDILNQVKNNETWPHLHDIASDPLENETEKSEEVTEILPSSPVKTQEHLDRSQVSTDDADMKSGKICENEKELINGGIKDDSFQELEDRLTRIAQSFEKHQSESKQRIDDVEKSCQDEVALRIDEIESEQMEIQKHLTKMAETEKNIFLELGKQKEFYFQQKQNNAACKIQAIYRGFKARKQFGDELNTRLNALKQHRWEERVARVEEMRKELKVKEASNPSEDVVSNQSKSTQDDEVKEHQSDSSPDTESSHSWESNLTSVATSQDVNELRIESFPPVSESDQTPCKQKQEQSLINKINEDLEILAGTSNDQSPVPNLSIDTYSTHDDNLIIDAHKNVECQAVPVFDTSAHNAIKMVDQSVNSGKEAKAKVSANPIMRAIDNDLKDLEKSVCFEQTKSNSSQEDFKHSYVASSSECNNTELDRKASNNTAHTNAESADLIAKSSSELVTDPVEQPISTSLPTSINSTDVAYNTESGALECDDHLSVTDNAPGLIEAKHVIEGNAYTKSAISVTAPKTETTSSSTNYAEQSSHVVKQEGEQFSENQPQVEIPEPNVSKPQVSSITEKNESDHHGTNCDSSNEEVSDITLPLLNSSDNREEVKFVGGDKVVSDNQTVQSFIKEDEKISSVSNNALLETSDKLSVMYSDETVSLKTTMSNNNSTSEQLHPEDPVDKGKEIETPFNDLNVAPLEKEPSCHEPETANLATATECKESNDISLLVDKGPPFMEQSENMGRTCEVSPPITEDNSKIEIARQQNDPNGVPPINENIITPIDVQGLNQKTLEKEDLDQKSDQQNLKQVVNCTLDMQDEPDSISKAENHVQIQKSEETAPCNDAQELFDKSLNHWRQHCTEWHVAVKDKIKTSSRRVVRKSSAAKRLPSFTEGEILNGKWPYSRGETMDSLEQVSRVFINPVETTGRNLVLFQRCVSLTHLTLIGCGLVSLEGLQPCPSLRHINVSHNSINVISCDGMTRLESVVSTHNKLTSIHGLTGCTSLMHLDMSDNNITRINGLESLIKLMHLRLANNQLIHLKGLLEVRTLLTLDVSGNHISSLHGIENCGLMRSITAENNNIAELNVGELENAILLTHLNLSRNSLSNLEVPHESEHTFWLPSLHTLNVSHNKLSIPDRVQSCFLCMPHMHTLNISGNLISNANCILNDDLKILCQLKTIDLSCNLLSKDQEIKAITDGQIYGVSVVFDDIKAASLQAKFTATVHDLLGFPIAKELGFPDNDDTTLSTAIAHINSFYNLTNLEHKNAKKLRGWKTSGKTTQDDEKAHFYPPDLVSTHCSALEKYFELSISQRMWYEKTPYSVQSCGNIMQHVVKNESVTSKQMASKIPASDVCHINSAKDETDALVMSTAKPQLPVIKKPSNVALTSHKTDKSLDHSAHSSLSSKDVYKQLEKRRAAGALETFAATKIQALWRMYMARQHYQSVLGMRRQAVITLQAAWRGFVIRKSIKSAMTSFNTSADLEDSDFDEIDLNEYNFDEETYDQRWALRTDLGRTLTPRQEPKAETNIKNTEDTQQIYPPSVHPLIRNEFGAISKPPLPPITPTGSLVRASPAPKSVCTEDSTAYGNETDRSKHSAKQERLTNEWGLQSQLTTELMLKRARKMKGKRKKEVSAGEKLKKFHEISQKQIPAQNAPISRKPTHPPNKMEYFKAREASFEKRDKVPSEDDERRRQYTYEWLHTKATCEPLDHDRNRSKPRNLVPVRPSRERSRESESGGAFLPSIPHRRSLVTSPLQVAGDMEVMSVSSYNSNRSRSKHLLRDIAKRHGGNDIS